MPAETTRTEKATFRLGSAFDNGASSLDTPPRPQPAGARLVAPPVTPAESAPPALVPPKLSKQAAPESTSSPSEAGWIPTQRVAKGSYEDLEKKVVAQLTGGYANRLTADLDQQLGEIEQNIEATKKRIANDSGWSLSAWGRWLTGKNKADEAILQIDQAALTALRAERESLVGEVQGAESVAQSLLKDAAQLRAQSRGSGTREGRLVEERAAALVDRAHEMLLRPEQYVSKLREDVKAAREGHTKVALQEASQESPTSARNLCIIGAAIFFTVATFGTAGIGAGLFAFLSAAGYAAFCGTAMGVAVGTVFNLAENGVALASGQRTFKEAASDFGIQMLKDFSLSSQNAGMTAAGFGIGGVVGRVLGLGAKILPASLAKLLGYASMPISSAVSANVMRTGEHVFATQVMGMEDKTFTRDVVRDGFFAALAGPIARFMPPGQAKTAAGYIGRIATQLGLDGSLAIAQNYCTTGELSVENLVEAGKSVMVSQAAGLGGSYRYHATRFPVETGMKADKPVRPNYDQTIDLKTPVHFDQVTDASKVLGIKRPHALDNPVLRQRAADRHAKLVAQAESEPAGPARDARITELHEALRHIAPDAPALKLLAIKRLGLNPDEVYEGRKGYETKVIKAYEQKQQDLIASHAQAAEAKIKKLEQSIQAETDVAIRDKKAKLDGQAKLARLTDAELQAKHLATEKEYLIASGQQPATQAEQHQAIRSFGLDPNAQATDGSFSQKLKTAAEKRTLDLLAARSKARKTLGVGDDGRDEPSVLRDLDAVVEAKIREIDTKVPEAVARKWQDRVLAATKQDDIRLQRDLTELRFSLGNLLVRPLPEGSPPYIRLGMTEFKSDTGKVFSDWEKKQRFFNDQSFVLADFIPNIPMVQMALHPSRRASHSSVNLPRTV